MIFGFLSFIAVCAGMAVVGFLNLRSARKR